MSTLQVTHDHKPSRAGRRYVAKVPMEAGLGAAALFLGPLFVASYCFSIHRPAHGATIADVKTPDDRVIEFQHSPLKGEERDARETFYKSMIWVVDGLARKRDLLSFNNTLRRMSENRLVYSGWKECALLRDWVGRPVDVFFDFGESFLWHLHPSPEGGVILSRVPVTVFIEKLHKAMPFERMGIKRPTAPAPIVPMWYLQYWHRRQRKRARF